MKPQELNLNSEALAEFRERMDTAIGILIRTMMEKGMPDGSMTAKIKVKMIRVTSQEGEIIRRMDLEPKVHVQTSGKGDLDCEKQAGLVVAEDAEGSVMVASNQVEMNELLDAG